MTDTYAIAERLDFIGLSREARETLRSLRPFIQAEIGPALEAFYARVRQTPAVRSFFTDERHIAGAQSGQARHWGVIAGGEFSDAYVKGVRTIGETHARIGLEPRWYIAGYALISEGLLRRLIETRWPKGLGVNPKAARVVADEAAAMVKAMMLDMDFALSIYLETLEAERQRLDAERQQTERNQAAAVAALGAALSHLARGDLRARITEDVAAEFAGLKGDFNAAISSLEQAVGSAVDAAQVVGQGVGQIGAAASDLSRRTEQQAANLEQTAAALEEITATVRRSGAGARDASAAVSGARQEAERSATVVSGAIGAMDEIEGSSSRIGQIIGVIDEIAFQTNLLALNAGVEAARAGEAGKGFAVVASEVRALAQRSAEAAKEIKALINQSADQVKAGVDLVGQTARALGAIGERVTAIDELVRDMAASAQEQTRALSEVNTAVNQLDQLTQQNAAMVEETTAATHALHAQSAGLTQLMGGFTVGGRSSGETARVRSAA